MVVSKKQMLAGESYIMQQADTNSIYLVTTNQNGILISLRSANLVFCANSPNIGTVAPILLGSNIEVTHGNNTITVKNTHGAGACQLNIMQLG